MSAVTQAVPNLHNPAAIALRQADDSVNGWLKGLVTGAGDSPSHIIVTGVLGVVPGVGQAMDARDLILGVIALSAAPTSPMAWLEILISLIGCVPAVGDALKMGFKLMVKGHSLARVLDSVSPKLRGNVEAWMKHIDWADISRTCRKGFDDTIGAFVNALDGWVIKTVMGRQEARHLIAQLEDLRRRAPKMLDNAIDELQKIYQKTIGDALPRSTARVGVAQAVQQKLKQESKKTYTRTTRKSATLTHDRSANNPAGVQQRNTKTKREENTRAKRWSSGVMAEHMADYHIAKNKRNLKKANNHGKLWEEWDKAGRNGIDHIWMNAGEPIKPGIIGETKSSLFGAFAFMAALPADIRSQMQGLGDAEAANPTPNEKPNVFHSEGRDDLDKRAKVADTKESEAAIKRGVGKTKTKGVQMSHKWIIRSIKEENLTAAGQELARLILKADRQKAAGFKPPYARWIIMVTGRQKHLHEKAQGHQHEIQKPLIILPDNILEK